MYSRSDFEDCLAYLPEFVMGSLGVGCWDDRKQNWCNLAHEEKF